MIFMALLPCTICRASHVLGSLLLGPFFTGWNSSGRFFEAIVCKFWVVAMPKKFDGENSKAAVAKARKTAAKDAEKTKKEQEAENEYWRDDDKTAQKKNQRKEEKEKKKTEQLVWKILMTHLFTVFSFSNDYFHRQRKQLWKLWRNKSLNLSRLNQNSNPAKLLVFRFRFDSFTKDFLTTEPLHTMNIGWNREKRSSCKSSNFSCTESYTCC